MAILLSFDEVQWKGLIGANCCNLFMIDQIKASCGVFHIPQSVYIDYINLLCQAFEKICNLHVFPYSCYY